MKKALLFLLMLCAFSDAISQVKVNALPNGAAISSGDFTICDQFSVTSKCTYSQVLTYVQAAMDANPQNWTAAHTFQTQHAIAFTGQTTGNQYQSIVTTGASGLFGVESSVGGTLSTGTAPYAVVIGTTNSTPVDIATNGVNRMQIDAA